MKKPKPSIGEAFGAFSAGKARHWLTFVLCAFLWAGLLGTGSISAQTSIPDVRPMTPELEARLKKLETELRCLVCQNQTLAESPAGLAGDLRREIRTLADSGKSNEEIKDYLKARYGDFVLYKPPLESKTWLLWFGPFVLLVGGAFVTWRVTRRTVMVEVSTPAISDDERRRAGKLLDE